MKIPFIKKKNLELHLTCSTCILYNIEKEGKISKQNFGVSKYNKWEISAMISKYLMMCDGKNTHREIVKNLNLHFDIIGDEISKGLINIDVIEFSEKETNSHPIKITGDFNSYCPTHMSVEITDYCNFKCKHCYVSASPKDIEVKSKDKIIECITKLKENGVRVIELTGGECTTHPDFKEIVGFSVENFDLVAIISNGYLIGKDKELANYLSSFDNVCVQISIDGMEEFHDNFRNKTDAFKYAKQACKYLKEKGTLVRVASTITDDNIDELLDLYELCKSLDVDAWATSIVMEFGRGECMSCNKSETKLTDKMSELLKPYENDKLFYSTKESLKSMIKNKEINCGGGWRSFGLNVTSGDFRTCLFLTESKTVGNIYEDDYKSIFNKEKTMMFKYAPNPGENLGECRGCKYIDRCRGCFARAFKIVEEEYPDCPWKNKYFNNI